jgi:glutamine synthetase
MTREQLKSQIKSGAIDTVLTAFPDPFGRLVGKRFRADYFLKSVLGHGTHGCSYLLTVNIEMDPLEGFKVANWEAGFGDFVSARTSTPSAFCPGNRALPWSFAI